jgi:hypothetical protein
VSETTPGGVDLTTLTEAELEQVIIAAGARRAALIENETNNRTAFTNEIVVTGIDKVETVATSARGRKAMTNADVGANIPRLLKDTNQDLAILARQVALLQHLVADQLTSSDLPSDS